MELPVLKKKVNKPIILLLSDDLRLHSGVGTMSREFVVGTADTFNWFQLGAGIKHPDFGKVFDLSADINREIGIDHADVKVMPYNGYGDTTILRRLLKELQPDAIVHFTDPRFWDWLYHMEHEVRQQCPIVYYNIWDAPPYPHYNFTAYASCDMLLAISKQTKNINKYVLVNEGVDVVDLDYGK